MAPDKGDEMLKKIKDRLGKEVVIQAPDEFSRASSQLEKQLTGSVRSFR